MVISAILWILRTIKSKCTKNFDDSLVLRFSFASNSLLLRTKLDEPPLFPNKNGSCIEFGTELQGTYIGITREERRCKALFLLDEEVLVDVIIVVDPCLFNYVFHL